MGFGTSSAIYHFLTFAFSCIKRVSVSPSFSSGYYEVQDQTGIVFMKMFSKCEPDASVG